MSGKLNISQLKFVSSPNIGKRQLNVRVKSVLLLVGPNNSGKSMALREIENWCVGSEIPRKVIESIKIAYTKSPAVAEKLIREFKIDPPPQQSDTPEAIWVGQHTFRKSEPTHQYSLVLDHLRKAVSGNDTNALRNVLAKYYTVRLDGRTRFSLSDQKGSGDLQLSPKNHLWALFVNDEAREKVRKLTEEAFGQHFTIDATGMQHFKIRLSDKKPKDGEDQGIDKSGRDFHSKAKPIEVFSDGVQAFIGLTSALLSLPHKIMLIDEPDAFLYPPLARRLGRNLALIAKERKASLICATHSSEFLMGCLETAPDAMVVRLTYFNGNATARSMPIDDLSEMTNDPLLRSTNVLAALFHKAVVVTEADADRSFYEEINRRLGDENRGIDDCLFLNAQNVQTIYKLVGPLRSIGIPAVAVLDLDFIKNSETEWKSLMRACGISTSKMSGFIREKDSLLSKFRSLSTRWKDLLKKQGVGALNRADKKSAEIFLNSLAKYGIFFVPIGELECWLDSLGVQSSKKKWLVNIFSKMGKMGSRSYLKPGNDDVWKFIDKINKWVVNPQRFGID